MTLLVGEKAYKETTYGEYCKHANITSDIVRMALRRENVNVQVDPRNYEVRMKEKKVRGRPTKHLVEHASDDSDSEHDSEPVSAPIKAPEPEPEPEVKEVKEKPKPKPKASKKKGTSLDEVKSDSDHEKEKHEEKDEEHKEPKEEKEKKPKKPRAPKKKGTSLDAEPQSELVKEDYEGELEELEKFEHDDGITYYIKNDTDVYNAEKKCVGKVDKNANLVLF
jgi:hypothetical protein